MSVCKKYIISLKIEYRATSVANNIYELNESLCSLAERKILTIDPIDFDVCYLENRETEREGRRRGKRERQRETDP